MHLSESASKQWLVRALLGGGCAIVVLWGIGLLIGSALLPLRLLGQSATCQSNLFRLTRAQLVYAEDYSERLPAAEGWMDRILPFVVEERRLHCPSVSQPGEDRYGYGLNQKLGGAVRSKIEKPDETPLCYDSEDLKRSAFDSFAS